MPKHDMTAWVPSHAIPNAQLAIEIRADGDLLGELIIRKGSVDWRASGHLYSFKMGWERFDELMRAHGKPYKEL